MDTKITPAVSIIIPVYNKATSLRHCLDSIQAQSLEDWELVLVDDGSSDGSSEICKVFAARDHRVKYEYQENRGAAAARNRGLGLVSGALVTFCDADDILYPDALRIMKTRLEEVSADLLVAGIETEVTDPEKWELRIRKNCGRRSRAVPRELYPEDLASLWRENNLFSCCAKLYRRELIEQNGIRFRPDMIVLEDLDFVLQYLDVCGLICAAEESVYCQCYVSGASGSILRAKKDTTDNVSYACGVLEEYLDKWQIREPSVFIKSILPELGSALNNLTALPTAGKEERRRKYRKLKTVMKNKWYRTYTRAHRSDYSKLEYALRLRGRVYGLALLRWLHKLL